MAENCSMSNVQGMMLEEDEVDALRRYLLNGGFLIADDFWAPAAWENVYREMKRVFPDREPRELTLDHGIFHIVYDFKKIPQVPSIFAWRAGDEFENWHEGPQADEDPHFWGLFDDDERLMALLCHNNDVGDGWEREPTIWPRRLPRFLRETGNRQNFYRVGTLPPWVGTCRN